MFSPEDFEQNLVPTIVIEGSFADNLDPLDELWLATEELLKKLLNDAKVVYGDSLKIEVKIGTAS